MSKYVIASILGVALPHFAHAGGQQNSAAAHSVTQGVGIDQPLVYSVARRFASAAIGGEG
jgi:hypothetical protein